MEESISHIIIHILEHSILDCLKIVPFLLITYILMEWLEHKTTAKTKKTISKADKFGPIIGGLLGMVPQCGFSVSATNLYVGRVISLGTLIAIYLSTSDEMLPIFLSQSVPAITIFKILSIKFLVGMIAGILIDLVYRKKHPVNEEEISKICEEEHCHCEKGILKSAIKHTLSITLFIFIITLVLNAGLEIIGEEKLANVLLNKKVFGPVIAGLIGLIPNCAASVVIAELYIKQVINVGTMLAGLLVGAGVGILVLFRLNKDLKENLKVIGLLYSIGVIVGIIFEIIGVTL